jgi:hypothetical protein
MKVVVVYIFPLDGQGPYSYLGFRFMDSYHANKPGLDHESIVVCNGAKPTFEAHMLFGSLPNLRFFEHDNSGYDIGAFQHVAREIPADLMVFFGVSTFFRRAGWLKRMWDSYLNHGNAQYGAMGNRGNPAVNVWPHIRTTAFWMNPGLLNAYPTTVTTNAQRHPFEHGKNCFTEWLKARGHQSWVITWKLDLLWAQWDSDPEGFSRGNQSNLLAGDHLCEPPYYPRR